MKIVINPFDKKSIDSAQKMVVQYKKDFERKAEEFSRRLAEIGVRVATAGFAVADYDGVNDVVVSMVKGANGYSVIASGETVGFIEFGTGIRYPEWVDNNNTNGSPYIPKPHGTYGDGKGLNPNGWYFSPGKGAKGTHTYGNYPAMAMLTARDQIVESVTQIAREVWR